MNLSGYSVAYAMVHDHDTDEAWRVYSDGAVWTSDLWGDLGTILKEEDDERYWSIQREGFKIMRAAPRI
jgi:hypothetical protein